jgi:hypothetical protein
MAKTGLKMLGGPAMQKKLRVVKHKYPDICARALYQEAQIEMTEAKRRTPVDTGVLRASGFVQFPERKGRLIFITLAFGGAAETYAVIVHEDLEAHHRIGQAKFLESVLNESLPYMASRIARRIALDKQAM